MTGTYVTIEGIDGAGKSTLAEKLGDELAADGGEAPVMKTVEPYEELWTGRAVREAIEQDSTAATDVLLFAADRAEHLSQVVEPYIDNGYTVVSDRGHDSTYAYQIPRLMEDLGVDELAARAWLDSLYEPYNVEPDATIWVDVPVDVAVGRMSGEEKWAKREFLEEVRSNYEDLYHREPTRVRWVDGDQDPDDVLADAMEAMP